MRPMENARKLNLADAFALHTLCAPTKKKDKTYYNFKLSAKFCAQRCESASGSVDEQGKEEERGNGRNGVMETEIRARHWPSSSSSHRRRHHYRHWQRDEHHNYGNWAARGFVKGVSGQSKKRLTKMATNLPMAVYVYICVCVRRLSLVFVF